MKKIITLIAIVLSINSFAQSRIIRLTPSVDATYNSNGTEAHPCAPYWSGWVGDCFVVKIQCVNTGGTVIITSCSTGVTIAAERLINSGNNNGVGVKINGSLDLSFAYESVINIIDNKTIEKNSIITIENETSGTMNGFKIIVMPGKYHIIDKKLMVTGIIE